MTRAVDTSVAIAAIVADHESHDMAEGALGESAVTVAHVAVETYAVLTRLPSPLRIDGASAAALVAARLPARWVTLEATSLVAAPERLAAAGIAAGAAYDGLIAMTALEHGLQLLSADRRAARTYRALGASFELLGR